MNTLIRKEVRLILPPWIAAMLLATLPIWFLWPGEHGVVLPSPGIPVFGPFIFGLLLLSVAPYGQELSLGTFSVLLAQPVPRGRIWVIKALVLGVALTLVLAALCVSNQIRVDTVIQSMKSSIWRNAFQDRVDQAIVLSIAETRHTALMESFHRVKNRRHALGMGIRTVRLRNQRHLSQDSPADANRSRHRLDRHLRLWAGERRVQSRRQCLALGLARLLHQPFLCPKVRSSACALA